MVRAALAAADAGGLVRRAMLGPDVRRVLEQASAIDLVAVGKAAEPMLRAAVEATGGVHVRAVLGVSPHEPADLPPRARWFVAAHPVPDARSVAAGRAVLDLAAHVGPGDVLVVLVSGGASALMALPAEGISLEDKQRTSERLLKEGAEIHALNIVRKHLSAIKGGQLAARAGGAVLTLAVSDVVGDDLSVIGSGPTVPDGSTFRNAVEILDHYGGRASYPPTVVARLARGAAGDLPETPKAGDRRLARSTASVIGGARTAVEGARAEAIARGYAVHVIETPVLGEARVAASELVEAAWRVRSSHVGPLCVLAAGETTVRVSGTGKGGRNQECALAMARDIHRLGAVTVAASVGTDGVDGPTDAAGAMVDTTTLTRADATGIGTPELFLDDNNSYAFFASLGDLIRTGPTNTNVGDLQIILMGNA